MQFSFKPHLPPNSRPRPVSRFRAMNAWIGTTSPVSVRVFPLKKWMDSERRLRVDFDLCGA